MCDIAKQIQTKMKKEREQIFIINIAEDVTSFFLTYTYTFFVSINIVHFCNFQKDKNIREVNSWYNCIKKD